MAENTNTAIWGNKTKMAASGRKFSWILRLNSSHAVRPGYVQSLNTQKESLVFKVCNKHAA